MHADDEFARWFPDDYTVAVKEEGRADRTAQESRS
jgi:hypothetical protein